MYNGTCTLIPPVVARDGKGSAGVKGGAPLPFTRGGSWLGRLQQIML